MDASSPGAGRSAEGAAGGARRWSYDVRVTTDAPVDLVWSLVGEAARWKEWAGFTTSELLREGTPAPDGVGALRRFGTGPAKSQEEVLSWEPPRHLAYAIVKGFPVRGYRADIELEPTDGGGTAVHWHGSFDDKVPGTGHVMQAVTRVLMANFARRLVRYAERIG